MIINKRQILINLLCFSSGWLLGVLYLNLTNDLPTPVAVPHLRPTQTVIQEPLPVFVEFPCWQALDSPPKRLHKSSCQFSLFCCFNVALTIFDDFAPADGPPADVALTFARYDSDK